VTGGKTGYTRAAGYCYVTGVEIGGRGYVMAFLGGDGKLTRFADFNRVAEWIDAGAPGGKVKTRVASKKAAKLVAEQKSLRVRAAGKATK
jgi:D-alanyl-D-alanine carboxypeptidase